MQNKINELFINNCIKDNSDDEENSDSDNSTILSPSSSYTNINNIKLDNDIINNNEELIFNPFNPNECNLGFKLFDNHTRQQTKNIKLTSENTENIKVKDN